MTFALGRQCCTSCGQKAGHPSLECIVFSSIIKHSGRSSFYGKCEVLSVFVLENLSVYFLVSGGKVLYLNVSIDSFFET